VRRHPIVLVATGVLGALACGGDRGDGGQGEAGRLEGTVTVLAASSLTDAFVEVARNFEERHPQVDVESSFAASSELAAQIEQGISADVFASADESNMDRVVDSGDVVAKPVVFARNHLEIAVERGNPKRVRSLADLERDGLVVVLCATQVPCGRFADEALARAGVDVTPASRAENVKATLSLVELGEADAAIVYATDTQASGGIEGVAIPPGQNVIAGYPIAPLAEAGNPRAAAAFIHYVRSADGQRALRRFGFLEP
jgi:molybdate transport system substrate-binding protein